MFQSTEGPNGICRKNLLAELKVMKELSPHKHVVQLLACITKSGMDTFVPLSFFRRLLKVGGVNSHNYKNLNKEESS